MKPPHRVLMVCMGNICRSPLMQGIVQHRIIQRGLEPLFLLDSAGTGGWHAGDPPDQRSINIARHYGVDISSQRARQICHDDSVFEWVLCADQANLAYVQTLFAKTPIPSFLFLEFATTRNTCLEIPDPYYGERNDFDHVFTLIHQHADAVIDRILNISQTSR
jgi:protein-tyrosine phosphatase